jgi:hypothetical protein
VTRITGFLKHNAIAIAALFIALGGTSYAAVAIPKGSVGNRQLRNGAVSAGKIKAGAVTPGKLASGSFGGRILDYVEIANNGQVLASDPKTVKTEAWNINVGGVVVFPHRVPKGCFPLASASSPSGATTTTPPVVGVGGGDGSAQVVVRVSSETSLTLAIICGR